MAFQVGEAALGREVGNLLEKSLNCRVATEGILPNQKRFDFFLLLGEYKIVIELKVGGSEKLPYAISQGDRYRESVGAHGIIAIVYPEDARREVNRPEDVEDIALSLQTSVMVLCPFLKDYYPSITLAELAGNLKAGLEKPTIAPSMQLVVNVLRHAVQSIALEVRRSVGVDHPVIKETVGSLDLFMALSGDAEEIGQEADGDSVKSRVADLAAYVLVNQILLSHILAHNLKLPVELNTVSSPIELNAYFKVITDIDYKAVYCIDVASNIPPSATNEVNTCIIAIKAIQPENLGHDLLGRIFHEFLPHETRKQLGTFYTRPQAAEILAGLSIDRGNDKVMDPACGSGTLLVASYRRKKSLGRNKSHRRMVGEEITGVDVMPFAAHLAALNLTMQSPKEPTNKTRIGVGNSLNMAPGDTIGGVSDWFSVFGGGVTGLEKETRTTKTESFKVEPVDVVIMNPPFTRKERLTAAMKGVRFQSIGNQNFWAYFIPLADSLLEKGGKIAAVLPRDIFRGEQSTTIRASLWSEGRYNLSYVVKSTKETAFSENARFRDFLIVTQKGGPRTPCAFVYIKRKTSDLTISEAADIADTVRSLKVGTDFEDDSVRVVWRDQKDITDNWRDLGHLVVFNTEAGDRLLRFYRDVLSKARLLMLPESKPSIPILRGLEPTTENLLNLLFVVSPLDKGRLGRSSLVLNSKGPDKISVRIGHSSIMFEIPISAVRKGLKTHAYIPRLDVGQISDLTIIKPFDGFKDIQRRLRVTAVDFGDISLRVEDRLSHLVLARRINITAPGTKLLAFFSDDRLVPGKAFWAFDTDVKTSRVLSVWFNSTFAFIELLLSQTETEGSFVELTKEKLLGFHIPDFQSCDTTVLEEAFELVRYEEVPALVQQFTKPCSFRETIDRAVLTSVGFSKKEIGDLLPNLYASVSTELQSWLDVMRKSGPRDSTTNLQLHLLPRMVKGLAEEPSI